MTVAQKLIIGHIMATVTPARTVVTNIGLSFPGVAILYATFGAIRSTIQNPMTNQMGSMNIIS